MIDLGRLASMLASVALVLSCSPKNAPTTDCGAGRSCDCTPGDPDCNPCRNGYRAALVGSACVATCSAPDIDCGPHGECQETAQGALCRCAAGYVGTSCSACANGLSQNAAAQCLGDLTAPGLLTLASVDDQVLLGELLPPAWEFLPLAPVASTVTDVAYARASKAVYALDAGRLVRVELATGKSVGLTADDADLGRALCLDEAGRRAFTASSDALYQVDLDGFSVTEVGSFGAQALEYDPSRGVLLGVDQQGAAFELAGSASVAVSQAPELTSLAMAFDGATGRAYFLGAEAETPDERLLRYCADALTRVGAVPAWQARIVSEVPPDPAAPYTLQYQAADSALLAVDLGDSEVSSVRVTVAHPDAAVCIVAEGSSAADLEVEVTAQARPGFIMLVAPSRNVHLDLTARRADGGASIVVHTAEGLDISGPSAGVAEYGQRAWANLGLTTLAKFEARPTSRLLLMDWASQATLPLALVQKPVGAALAWVGEGP